MTENKPRRLSDVVESLAPEGANDIRWFLVKHQLAQAKMSLETARTALYNIVTYPENAEEREIAEDCENMVKGMYVRFLNYYTSVLSYLSGADVPERIARKEL